jgi:hypothetical protein
MHVMTFLPNPEIKQYTIKFKECIKKKYICEEKGKITNYKKMKII